MSEALSLRLNLNLTAVNTMQPSITCYLDCVSPYSYFAFTHLQRHAALLSAHNIATTYVPVFLGGINAGSGNKPPWTLPAKAAYAATDLQHAKRHFGLPNLIQRPSVFPTNSLRAQRGLTFIAAHHPPHIYHEAFRLAWVALWEKDTDISRPEHLQRAWTAPGLFTREQLQEVLAAAEQPEWKDRLQQNTKAALESGAFGAPWFVVRNGEGAESVFFGSDRFAFMWAFLGLPVEGERAKL